MNADLKTSYPITSAPPGFVATKTAPCLECNYPTTDPEQLCSIACRNRVNRNRPTAPFHYGDGLQRIVHTPGGNGGRGNFGAFRRTYTMDNQQLN